MSLMAGPAPIAIAMAILVLFCILGMILIPILDEALRRQASRLPANDNPSPEAGSE